LKKYNQFLLIAVPILCILSFVLSLKRSYFADEGWYLLTLSRMVDGDVLYRDIWSNVTPLGYYIGLTFTHLFGIEIWALRTAAGLIFLGNVLLIFRILQKLSLGITYQISAAIILMMYDPPGLAGSGTLYTPLGKFFFLLCFDLALLWLRHIQEEPTRLEKKLYLIAALTGVTAGLSFVSKQNIGGYALAAFVLCIMSSQPFYRNIRRHLHHLLIIGLLFISTIIIFITPTYLNGGFPNFIEFTFTSQTLYIENASISYWYQVKVLIYYLRQAISFEDSITLLDHLRNMFSYSLFLLPPVSFSLLLSSAFLSKPEDRQTTFFVLLFSLFGFMGAYPRFDHSHVAATVPALIIALLYAAHQLYDNLVIRRAQFKKILPHLARASIVMWTLIWVLTVAYEFQVYLTGPYRISTITHFQGIIVPDDWQEDIEKTTEDLIKFSSGSQVFFYHQDASLYYLMTGMRNILPFDYWANSSFGLNGQQHVIDTIKRGQIQMVYLDFLEAYTPLAAVQLEHFIRDNMAEDKTWEGSGHIFRTVPAPP
jgi:4-amino-4-deoxy-L-arabinose transferase-like glycosyltransferase